MKTIIFASEHYFSQRHNAPDARWINMEHVCDSPENYQQWLDENIPLFKQDGYDKFIGLTDLTALVASHCEYLLGIRSETDFRAIMECLDKPSVRAVLGDSSYNVSVTKEFPAFIKPIHSSLSQGSGLVTSHEEYLAHCEKHSQSVYNTTQKYRSFGEVAGFDAARNFHSFYGESIIPEGTQITVDVLAHQSVITILSVSESVFHPHLASFDKFDFPFSSSEEVARKIDEASRDIATKLKLDNLLFNIEFVVDGNDIYLIEVNPRPATQFIPAIKAVAGFDAWEYLNSGAVSFVEPTAERMAIKIFRVMDDELIRYVPSSEIVNELKDTLGANYNSFVEIDKRLSEYQQDGVTYRVGELYIPYGSKESLDEEVRQALKILSQEAPLSEGILF